MPSVSSNYYSNVYASSHERLSHSSKIKMSQIDTSKLRSENPYEVEDSINKLFDIALRPSCNEQKEAQDVLFKTFSHVERTYASNYVSTKCLSLYDENLNNKIEIDSSRKLKYIYGSNLDNTTDIKIISQELSGDSLSSDIWDSTRFINDDEITGSINKIRENFGIANNLSIREPIGLEMLERILSITSSNTPSIAPPRRPPNKVAQIPPNKFSPPVIPERMSKDVLFPVCVDNHWILVVQSKKNQGNDAIVFHSGNEHALSPEIQSKLAGLFNNIEYKHSALQDSELTPNACGLFLSKAIESVMTKDRRKPVTEALDEFINEFSVMDSPQKLNFNISTRRSLYADFVDYFNTGNNRWISYSCLTRPTL